MSARGPPASPLPLSPRSQAQSTPCCSAPAALLNPSLASALPGRQVDEAGIDMLLVGDSVAMVVHGHDTTLPITMDEMLVHCKAVARGARRAFLVGDMPFGSGVCSCGEGGGPGVGPAWPLHSGQLLSRRILAVVGCAMQPRLNWGAPAAPVLPPAKTTAVEVSPEQAVQSAIRMMKEGQMDAVKIEGGFSNRVKAVSRLRRRRPGSPCAGVPDLACQTLPAPFF